MPRFVPDRLIGLAGSVRLGLGPRQPVRLKAGLHPSMGGNMSAEISVLNNVTGILNLCGSIENSVAFLRHTHGLFLSSEINIVVNIFNRYLRSLSMLINFR